MKWGSKGSKNRRWFKRGKLPERKGVGEIRMMIGKEIDFRIIPCYLID